MTRFEEINQPRKDGFPKVNELSRSKVKPYKIDIKDPNFDKPIDELIKIYK